MFWNNRHICKNGLGLIVYFCFLPFCLAYGNVSISPDPNPIPKQVLEYYDSLEMNHGLLTPYVSKDSASSEAIEEAFSESKPPEKAQKSLKRLLAKASTRLLSELVAVFGHNLFDVKVIGAKNLKNLNGGAIILWNHPSKIEPAFLGNVIYRHAKLPTFLVAKSEYGNGLFRFIFNLIGAIPIDRTKKVDAGASRQLVKVLRKDRGFITVAVDGGTTVWGYVGSPQKNEAGMQMAANGKYFKEIDQAIFKMASKYKVPIVLASVSFRHNPRWISNLLAHIPVFHALGFGLTIEFHEPINPPANPKSELEPYIKACQDKMNCTSIKNAGGLRAE